MSKLKAFADNKLNMAYKGNLSVKRIKKMLLETDLTLNFHAKVFYSIDPNSILIEFFCKALLG